jgi:hypothetical protein
MVLIGYKTKETFLVYRHIHGLFFRLYASSFQILPAEHPCKDKQQGQHDQTDGEESGDRRIDPVIGILGLVQTVAAVFAELYVFFQFLVAFGTYFNSHKSLASFFRICSLQYTPKAL